MSGQKKPKVTLALDVCDARGEKLRVPFELDWTVGDVRNSLNMLLPSGRRVAEFEVVPEPWSHYVSDDAETFQGPGDTWRLIDVFFEQLCLALRDVDEDGVVTARATSLAPLGRERKVGVLFPDTRDVTADDEKTPFFAVLLAAADRVLPSQSETLRRRVRSLALSLATLERDLRSSKLRDVAAVAGFGLDGELAALVFSGCLCFDDALHLLEATTRNDPDREESSSRFRAFSVDDQKNAGYAVTHRIVPGVAVVAVPTDAEPPAGAKLMQHSLVEGLGAHAPHCDALALLRDCPGLDDEGRVLDEPRFPFFSNGHTHATPSLADTLRSTVDWTDTCRAMHRTVTHFFEVGNSDRLTSFLPFILDDEEEENGDDDDEGGGAPSLVVAPAVTDSPAVELE